MANKKFDHEIYFGLQRKYEAKYGPKTIIIAQLGSFYDVFEYDLPNRKEGKLYKVREIIDGHYRKEFVVTRAKKGPQQIGNPLMLGLPMNAFDSYYKNTFLNLGYTLVMYEQKKKYVTTKKGTKKLEITREVTKVLTKGTDIEAIHHVNSVTNKIVSLVFEVIKIEKKIEMSPVTIGYSSIDLISGKVEMTELYGSKNDPQMCLLRLSRMLSIRPKELIIHLVSAPPKYYSYIYRYLGLNKYDPDSIVVRNQTEKEYFRGTYQIQFLKKVYPNVYEDEINDLSVYLTSGVSLVVLLNYCNDHNSQIIKNIGFPNMVNNNNRLFISRETIIHLNMYDSYYLEKRREHQSINSLLSIIDMTKTHMGKRHLVKRFNQPYTKVDKINSINSVISTLISKKDNILEPITKTLPTIPDIDLLHRKLKLNSIKPRDLARLTRGYLNIIKIIDLLGSELFSSFNLNEENKIKFGGYVDLLVRILDRTVSSDAKVCENFIESEAPIFNSLLGVVFSSLTVFSNSYEKILTEWRKSYGEILKFTNLVYNAIEKRPKIIYKNDCYYITLSNKESKKVKKILKEKDVIISFHNGGKVKRYNISTKELETYTNKASQSRVEYQLITYQIYATLLTLINKEYEPLFVILSKFISKLDYMCSGANVALKYNYVRPNIIKSHKSYVKIKNLRHPIVERIIDEEYIPNDLEFGSKNTPKGMLLYGCNSSGKSTLTKSLGIAIIMAQTGYYVPARSFEISPYKYLITRLSGNDNMFAGNSSFVVEMKELNTIIKYSGPNTMILGDELCRGTGSVDGAALTVDTLERVLRDGSNFIFSTHMYTLINRPQLKPSINNGDLLVNHFHFTLNEEEEIVYDRKLKPGMGGSLYGIEVARSVGLPKDFIERAYQIRKEILSEMEGSMEILNPKRSNYHSGVYVHECKICGSRKNLETHHIRAQKLANDIKYIGHIPRDAKFNMEVLCFNCHRHIEHGHQIKKINSKYKLIRK